MEKTLDGYLGKKYPFVIVPDTEGSYMIWYPDLPGCISCGDTIEETIAMGEDARDAWTEISVDCGDVIPEPNSIDLFDLVNRGNDEDASTYTFKQFKHMALKNPLVKLEYLKLEPYYDIIRAMMNFRVKNGLTSKQLSKRTGIKKHDLKKLESGDEKIKLSLVTKLAAGMGMKVKIVFEPIEI